MEKMKRYVVFFVGLFINSLGVSLITLADLGTSPISSVPYVLSLNFPLTLGAFTVIFNAFLILLQLLILRKDFKPEYFLQIPATILFGYFIDLTMELFHFIHPAAYPAKILALLIGCLVLGFGVYLEVLANVVMLPGESFVRAVSAVSKKEFGITKVLFDVTMAVCAAPSVSAAGPPPGRSQRGNHHRCPSGGLYCQNVWKNAEISGIAAVF